jgi:hypothetical protein
MMDCVRCGDPASRTVHIDGSKRPERPICLLCWGQLVVWFTTPGGDRRRSDMAKYFVSWEGKVSGLSHVEASSEHEAVLKFRDNPDHHKLRFLTGVYDHVPEDVIPESTS